MTRFSKPDRLPKVVGADIELGNFISGWRRDGGTGREASRLLLRHMPGVPGSSPYGSKADPQDIGRKWQRNGSCSYIDLDHLEICLPEVRSAFDFTAALQAQLRIARCALIRANATLPEGVTVEALVCNSDGSGASWGSHLNFLVTRRCFDNIFRQRMHYLLWLASYQACSVLITGQGKVGSENDAPAVDFQLSQRADFFEEMAGPQTTYHRPIINSRDEPLCASNRRYARFHHIASDCNLADAATVLKVGILQILLAMVESDAPQIRPEVILQDPVRAFIAFSHDPRLTTTAQTLGAENLSTLDLQRRFFDAAADFVARGGCDDTVPRVHEILSLWSSTLDCFAIGDWDTLSRRLDWVLKKRLLDEVLDENPGLDWQSPEVKRLDLLYGSLDDGLYRGLESAGMVDRLVTEREVDRFVSEPPSDTRAYTRGHLLRMFGRAAVLEANWDRLRIRDGLRGDNGKSSTVTLDDPLGSTRAHTGGLFKRGRTLLPETILNALNSVPEPSQSVGSDWAEAGTGWNGLDSTHRSYDHSNTTHWS